MHVVQSGTVDVGGVRLTWHRSGPRRPPRPTVVLAHGLCDDAACWGRTARDLAQEHDVVSFDARGHGASDRAADYSLQAHTRDLVSLVRALGLERPVLVGHSMGGVHAVLASAEVEVAALVLEDPAWPDPPADGSKDAEASRGRQVEVAALPGARRWERGRALHPAWDDDDLRSWSLAQTLVDPDAVRWFDSWPAANRWEEHVSTLTCPGLLLHGTPSAVSPAMAARARALWPQLRVVEVAGAGHDVRRDRFDGFWRGLRGFLEALR
ncbi:alpha/beta fold hydrolase [Quadrisphaera oryzae]|uniref:alpha/beta fold hydrolase n=1 Tax=Quadrisphaera TaxID=317661 RepID=UPI0016485242|nr:alpha/beta fold hydrolase [Quadrisphaera sp. RL12-1S]